MKISTSRNRRAAAVWAVCALAAPIGAQGATGQGGVGQPGTTTQSLEAIRKAAETFVRSQIPGPPNTIEITVGPLDSRLRLAPCAEPLKASLPSGATFRARTTVAVSCKAGTSWTVYVPVSIESNVSSLVLRHAAVRGARLSAEDVEVQVRKVPGTSASYLTDATQLAGRSLKRPMAAGTVLSADAFVEDALVRRGQQVTLIASAGGFEVRATGKALNDGKAAGRVRVQNASSNQVVEGVVESASVIRITP